MHPKLNVSLYSLDWTSDDKDDVDKKNKFVEFSRLDTLSDELISAKNKFALLPVRERNFLCMQTDWHKELKSHITERLGGQVVTRAWLKLHEILAMTNCLENLFAKCQEEKRGFAFFCNAELPGAFLSCLNHHIANHPRQPKKWDWLASSLRTERAQHAEQSEDGKKSLDDSYGLYENYRDHWLQSKDEKMNGDVTVPENITMMTAMVKSKFPDGVDLYTSDGGTDVDQDPNQQEALNSTLRLGEIILGLLICRPGGCMLVKHYTLFKPFSWYMLSFLVSKFRKCTLLKPETSPARNSEIYIWLEDYCHPLQPDSDERAFLLEMQKFCHSKKCPPTSLAVKAYIWDVPLGFGNRLFQITKDLTQRQCLGLKFYQDLAEAKMKKERFAQFASLISSDFLKKYPVIGLSTRQQLRTSRKKPSKFGAPQRSPRKSATESRRM
jgi:hypothetical protein